MPTLPSDASDALRQIGNSIKIARISRKLSQQQLAERMTTSRNLVIRMEGGDPSVSMGAYVTALWTFGLDLQFAESIAPAQDEHGCALREQSQARRVRPDSEGDLERRMDF